MTRIVPPKDQFDYVIVGGGTAGCVLARRLSDDPEVSVLLLERGPAYPRRLLTIPLVSKRFMGRYLDPVETTPQAHCGNRCVPLPIARVLGGGSAINSMIYLRGEPASYDRWIESGATGWSYRDLLPYFMRMEDFQGDPGSWHGVGGPVGVSRPGFQSPFGEAFLAACEEKGISRTEDFNGPSPEGAGFYHFTQSNGSRSSAARDYLAPVSRRPNLTIWIDAEAHRLLLEQGRAAAVSGVRRGRPFTAFASREIVLAAGAFGSPRLLLLSGIGPAGELGRLGIGVRHDLPGVGKGLQDHPRCSLLFLSTRPVSLSLPSLGLQLLRWGFTRDGLLTSPGVAAGAFFRILPDSTTLDCQLVANWAVHRSRQPTVALLPLAMEVESRGRVQLRSDDPSDPLLIDPNYLAAERDRQILLAGFRMARDLAATAALRSFGLTRELTPGDGIRSEAELTRFLACNLQTAFHPSSTCAMGTGPEAVVDSELRVRGVVGLRVADVSVMPRLVNANTNGPALMIGEKAADLIRGRAPLPEQRPRA